MGRYSVQIKKSATKELEAIPGKKDRQRLVARIRALADDPRPVGAEKLSGFRDRYRIRQGNYRVLYEIADEALVVYVVKIGDRRCISARRLTTLIEPTRPAPPQR